MIGASADGIAAIARLVSRLPRDLAAPVLVVQHVGRTSIGCLPEILAKASPLRAIHPYDGQPVEAGTIFVAPPDHHMLVCGGLLHLTWGPRENYCRPSVDVSFRSAALAYGAEARALPLRARARVHRI